MKENQTSVNGFSKNKANFLPNYLTVHFNCEAVSQNLLLEMGFGIVKRNQQFTLKLGLIHVQETRTINITVVCKSEHPPPPSHPVDLHVYMSTHFLNTLKNKIFFC